MIKLLLRIRSYFHHPTPHPDAEEERKTRLVIMFTLLISLFSVLMFTARYVIEGDRAPQTIWLLLIAPVVFISSLFSIKRFNNSRIPTYVMFVFGLFVVFMRAVSTGAIFSPVAIWVVLVPSVAILLLPRKQSFLWVLLSIFTLVALAYPEALNLPYKTYVSSEIIMLIVLILLVLLLSFLMYFFEAERLKNEQRIRETEAALAASNRLVALGNVSGGMAHEINNPLAIIRSHADILEAITKEDASPRMRESLQGIKHGVKRIEGIVNSLRPFTRDDFFAQLQSLQIRDLMTDVLNEKREFLRERSIYIETSFEGEGHFIGIREFTFRILTNLIDNAASSIKGSPQPWIKVSVYETSDFLYVKVTDSGPPIPFDLQQRIFEPFFSTKGQTEHSGLGLTICSNLMKAQKGVITYDQSSSTAAFELRFAKDMSNE